MFSACRARDWAVLAIEFPNLATTAFLAYAGTRPLAALAELLLHPGWRASSGPGSEPGDHLASPGEREGVEARLAREPGFFGMELRSRARRRPTLGPRWRGATKGRRRQ